MKRRRWFSCGRVVPSTGDGLHRLREVVVRLCREGASPGYALVAVAPPAELAGFDRLAARLEYARVLAQSPAASHVTLTGAGPVVALWTPDGERERWRALRARLHRADGSTHPPRLRFGRLPVEPEGALRLLVEFSS
ncbi:hypothetical protein LX16_3521 [Stackebrandtia albiflava]|uniref:Uncharacterized protein n=1 Tax=Stackebrandtia albiflava TaxID=406432 RepID=A0A562V4L4_9ACTN|nr:hypothetical protein [Stackebrandtia albiflava]TWJ12757.1 hypothetical protein LX16_3521 [Stackebrandtia albiflava]